MVKPADDLLLIGIAIREMDNQSMVDRLARAAADALGRAGEPHGHPAPASSVVNSPHMGL